MTFRTAQHITAAQMSRAMDEAASVVFGAPRAIIAKPRVVPISPLMQRIVEVLQDETDFVTAQEIGDEIKAPGSTVTQAIKNQKARLEAIGLEIISKAGGGAAGFKLRNIA